MDRKSSITRSKELSESLSLMNDLSDKTKIYITKLENKIKRLESAIRISNEENKSINIIKGLDRYMRLEKFISGLNESFQLRKNLESFRRGKHRPLVRNDAMEYENYIIHCIEEICGRVFNGKCIDNLEKLKNISDDKLKENNLDRELLNEIIEYVKLKIKTRNIEVVTVP
jgi:hypothetical protein